MATYLIDFENVHSDGLKGIDTLSESDSVYLFYSQNADTITFDTHFKLIKSKANFEMFEAKRLGKNAIDFHLATFLGYLIAKNTDEAYFVISKDNGFQFSFDFWRQYFREQKIRLFYAYSIERALTLVRQNKLASCQEAPATDDSCTAVADEADDDNVPTVDDILIENGHPELVPPAEPSANMQRIVALRDKLDEDCTDEELVKLLGILDNFKSRQELYRSIIKLFGQSRGLAFYHCVKKKQ
ncbi:MAG TPA: PIN domain-containing protein [Bacillota bacterium]|nr:PIN domain-containing protein [Bacillota bacterium]